MYAMLWITLMIVIQARADVVQVKSRDSSPPGNYIYNELNVRYDHCREPQILNRETWTCECPPPLRKDGDECVCDDCLFKVSEASYSEKRSDDLPEYLSNFLRQLDQSEEEERRISESGLDGGDSGGIGTRMLWTTKKTRKKKKPKNKKFNQKTRLKGNQTLHHRFDKYMQYVERLLKKVNVQCEETNQEDGTVRRVAAFKNPRVIVASKDSSVFKIIRGLGINPRRKKMTDEEQKVRPKKIDWEKVKIINLKKGSKQTVKIDKPKKPVSKTSKTVQKAPVITTVPPTTTSRPVIQLSEPSTMPPEPDLTSQSDLRMKEAPAEAESPAVSAPVPKELVNAVAQGIQEEEMVEDGEEGMSFSDNAIGNETWGMVKSGSDKAYGGVSNYMGTGSMSLGTGSGSAAAAAHTGRGVSVSGVESRGAKAFGLGMIGKKAHRGSSTTTLLIGEGDAIATNTQSRKGSASATAVSTKKIASVGSAAYGAATAAASATPGKGAANGTALYGENLEASAAVQARKGPIAETVSVGNSKDKLEDLLRNQEGPSELQKNFITGKSKARSSGFEILGIGSDKDSSAGDWFSKN